MFEPDQSSERTTRLFELAATTGDDLQTRRRIENGLAVPSLRMEDLAILLSPAAAPYLEEMAQKAKRLTRGHFGNTIELYIPLYISNECSNGCDYCGFASDREVQRARLSPEQIEQEASVLAAEGFDEILLLTGERVGKSELEHLRQAVQHCGKHFNRVTVETYPMEIEEYAQLVEAGLFGVTIYQETYDMEVYDRVHRWGPKRDYRYRLATPERALEGGAHSVGLGALLGLADARQDLLQLATHLRYLAKRYWNALFSVSFPRLRPEVNGYQTGHPVSDRELAQFIFAFRLAFPKFPLVLSTRESAHLRDNLAGVGVSKMSVGSKTTVGGYDSEENQARQFDIADQRSREAFCAALNRRGLLAVYKNWDRALV